MVDISTFFMMTKTGGERVIVYIANCWDAFVSIIEAKRERIEKIPE